jgi:hypothetical protein
MFYKEPIRYDECEIFVCDCSDVAHQIVFQLWDFNKDLPPEKINCCDVELTMSIPLNPAYGFWKRVWLGIKYIFGYQSKYGHYDIVSVRREDIPRMIALLEKYRNLSDRYLHLLSLRKQT